MMLQVAVNGDRSKADHPAAPVTAEELARDARECLAAGAQEFHVHVRDGDGKPTLAPGYVDAAVSAMHSAGAHAVGVTTIADIEPDLQRRLDLVSRWTRPAYSSVNLSEEGAVEVMRALLAAGIGIEAGVWTPDDARALVACGLDTRVGLEDTLHLPDGSRAPGNAALVRAARALGAGQPD
jgi:uncharacterized protein (DUF849 family)